MRPDSACGTYGAYFFSIETNGVQLQLAPMRGNIKVKRVPIVVLIVLTGCASNSGVVPIGGDTYMVSRQAATGFSGMGTLKADAMREAYGQCQKTGKVVKVIETIDAKPPYILGNYPKTEVRFECVAKS